MLNYFLCVYLADKIGTNIYIETNFIQNDHIQQRYDTRSAIFKILNYEYITNNKDNYNTYTINNTDEYIYLINNNINLELNYKINILHINDINFIKNNIYIIEKYLNFENLKNDISIEFDNSIIISLRLGMGEAEIINPSPFAGGLRLPYEYYRNTINSLIESNKNIKTLVICSDNYNDLYINNFNEFTQLNVILCKNKNTIEQFGIIKDSKYFISSNSSFSLVAALFNKDGVINTP
jgi:hypothetical protein